MSMLPMDDREGMIWLDGVLVPWREARLHVLSHGLHYASAVFEGERVYRGRVFALAAHGRRLLRSCAIMDMECPYGAAALDDAAREVVAANGIEDGYLRRIAWRGSEQLGVAARATHIHVAVAAWPWPRYFAGAADGLRLALGAWRRPAPETAPVLAKASCLYAIGTLAKHAAERAGCDDALLLDWRGRVAEATGANIFFVQEGLLHTPVTGRVPERHHAPDGDRARACARHRGGRARDHAGRAVELRGLLPHRLRCGGGAGAADRRAGLRTIAADAAAGRRLRGARARARRRGRAIRRMKASGRNL